MAGNAGEKNMVASNVSRRSRSRSNRTVSGSGAMRKFRRQAAIIKDDAYGLAESAGELAQEQLDPVRHYVTTKPVQSLLIAAGVGLVFGIIFSRS